MSSVIVQGFALGSVVSQGYGGSGSSGPFLTLARSLDARTVEIYYDVAVTNSALILTNYSISPTLAVLNIIRITDNIYQITTSRQTAGVDYTITATSIIAS